MKLKGADAELLDLKIDTISADSRQYGVLTARMAIAAAACHLLTHIFKPRANHCFLVVPGDGMSAETSERPQFFKAAALE